MRVIKLAIISFVFLFGMITVISLFIPSRLSIAKSINVLAPKDSVFALINNTNRWSEWYPAFQNSEQKNKIEIVKKESSDSSIIMEIHQPNKKNIVTAWQLLQQQDSDSLTLQWYMQFSLKWYPWQKISSLFYNDAVGREMEKGLQNIRQITNEQ